ncbi:MAG: hypothetical protein ACRDQX_06560 [Pseudonocardiaceae bacterium]
MTQTASGGLDELRAAMVGAALLPGDPGYDGARSIWNGEIDRRPAVIARCESCADVRPTECPTSRCTNWSRCSPSPDSELMAHTRIAAGIRSVARRQDVDCLSTAP